jgi:hypothetical protein
VWEQSAEENIYTWGKVTGEGENCVMRSFVTCTLRHIGPVSRAIKSKKISLVGLVARMRDMRNTCSVLVRKYERNIPLRR